MPILNEMTVEEKTPVIALYSAITGKEEILSCPIIHGNWEDLPINVKNWAKKQIDLCQPDALHIMTGSAEEDRELKAQLVKQGVIIPLPKYDNCYMARTDPRDVARVESKTYISTPTKEETVPIIRDYVHGSLGNWMCPFDMEEKVGKLFPGCMNGRTMYLIPFSMGPINGELSKYGIELSDSAYVAISMSIMTRVHTSVLASIKEKNEFIKCLHTVGKPLKAGEKDVAWPCNPKDVFIAHKPHTNEIISFGSGYGGNSLLGKKCFALRIGSSLAKKQGWLAEHQLVMGVQRGSGEKKYICAAFPSACGKTNLAMLNPSLPGYKITCVGDDIAWLRFDKNGDLRAINPENGFFGVAPGTSRASNPIAMDTIFKDTLFTNVALTDEGGVWWEGMTKQAPEHLVDWLGNEWTRGCGRNAAHPNSRFCSPAVNCPILDEDWENPKGVKISAILFGGRRPQGVPLVTEARSWEHGVFMGAALRSESTAAAEHQGKVVMHDPFSMRPFFGYNFGHYLQHWLNLGHTKNVHLPKMFMVNWFRRSADGGFLWPGFGDNIRVIDWIIRRCDGEQGIEVESKVGLVPTKESINLDGLEDEHIDWDELFSTPAQFWRDEADEIDNYFSTQVARSLPEEMREQLAELKSRFSETN